MTVNDLIEGLKDYDPKCELVFDVGNLSAYDYRIFYKQYNINHEIYGEIHIDIR